MYSNLNIIIISKLDLEKLLCLFVDVCLVLCRLFVYFLSMFARFNYRNSVRNQSVLSRVFTSPLCESDFVHPQVVLLIVSSHLLKVPLIVSWLNIVICNRTCEVIYNAIIISKLDLEKLLCLFVYFLLMFPPNCDGYLFIICRCLFEFLSILCSYYCARSQ